MERNVKLYLYLGLGAAVCFVAGVLYVSPRKLAVEVGTPAPPLVATSYQNSSPRHLTDFHGRVVLLNFWATWCTACREEFPSLERLSRDYRDQGLSVVAVSIDLPGTDLAAAVKQFGLDFDVLRDSANVTRREYDPRGIPTSFLIDRMGKLHAILLGSRDWTSAAMRQEISTLLTAATVATGSVDDRIRQAK